MDSSTVLGIDIGGSHITAALVNLDTGAILPDSWVRRSVDSGSTAEEIIGLWSLVMQEVLESHGLVVNKIGIAMPGPFDYQKGISLMKDQGKFDALYGLNVKELLAEKLSVKIENIRLMNDAGCFLKGEVFGGAAKGYQRAIGLTLGTGLGTASYKDGVAEDADLWSQPFKDGIAEDYLSTRWFIKRYYELSSRQVQGVKELMERAATDKQARKVFEEFGQNLAQFLTFFIETDKPEIVVLGGNIAHAYELFLSELEKGLVGKMHKLPLLKAVLGEGASLIGAASCWVSVEPMF